MKKLSCFFILISFLHYSPIAYAQAVTGDDLWNQYKSDPDNHPNIPNGSYAGYNGAECGGTLPDPDHTVYNVKNAPFNAKGDGTTDDSQAFESAIAAAEDNGSGIVFIPKGKYKITKILKLRKNNIILRGEGRDVTILDFPKSLQGIYGDFGRRWWWAGGVIWVGPADSWDENGKVVMPGTQGWEYWRSPSVITTVTSTTSKGNSTIKVASTSGLNAGMKILLSWDNPSDRSLLKHIYGHAATENELDNTAGPVGNCAGLLPPGIKRFQWPVEIKSISGTDVTLSQPLRIDIKPEWNVRIEQLGQSVQEVGIEKLRIQCHAQMTHAHLETPTATKGGWNGIYINRAWNCWVNDVAISSAEEGVILAAAKNVTVANVLLDGTEQHHHSFACRISSHDNLFEKFEVNGPKIVHHGINTEMLSSGNVWSKGIQKAGTFDSHRAMSFDYIRTECVVANNKGSGPGGASDAGPFVGKRTVHWNVHIFIDPDHPLSNTGSNGGLYVYQPKQYSMGAMVGIRGASENTNEGWAMPVGDKGVIVVDDNKTPAITNLYEAQKTLRCGFPTSVNHQPALTDKTVFGVYPNPASNFITAKIFSPEKDIVTIKLINIHGSKVFEKELEVAGGENSFNFNSFELKSGIYLIVLEKGTKEVFTKKLLVN